MFKGNEQSSSDSQDDIMIDRSMVMDSKIEVQNLICSICHNILWDALSCGAQKGCHACFCSTCIEAWLRKAQSVCPHCKCVFIRSNIPPVMHAILCSMRIKCVFCKEGCPEVLAYSELTNHVRSCSYKLKRCEGCSQQVCLKLYETHTDHCEKFLVECNRCNKKMPKYTFKEHNQTDCLQNSIITFGQRITHLHYNINELTNQTQRLESVTKCFLSGQPLQLYISFFTTFSQHFVFPNPTLIKASFNEMKQKYDFLHFYVVDPISVNSIVSMKWAIKIEKMSGNILLGFCSSMNINSLDYIVNKYGELKKKVIRDVRYRIIRKSQFSFSQGDVIRCKYVGLMKSVLIVNQTKNLSLAITNAEVQEFAEGGKIFIFFSMDTLNDSISFLL